MSPRALTAILTLSSFSSTRARADGFGSSGMERETGASQVSSLHVNTATQTCPNTIRMQSNYSVSVERLETVQSFHQFDFGLGRG